MGELVNWRRRGIAGIVSMVVGAACLVGALPGNVGAAAQQTTPSSSVVADPDNKNPDCSDLGDFAFEFRIDNINDLPEEKTYTDPVTGIQVTISDVKVVGGIASFDFTSTIPVSAVFVKSGPGGILYTFDPPTTTGNDLKSPNDTISHISFCWNPPPPTTEVPTTEVPTTEVPTTEVPTTEVPTTVGVSPTTAGVAPTTVPGELPRTGSTVGPMVGIGAALLAGGAGLIGFARRFRHS